MALRTDQLRGRVPNLIGGKYEVLATLGSGGMSDVFKVRHVELEQVRALKVLSHGPTTKHPELVTRFRREAKRMATFRHDHIVQVYDFGRDGDLFYLVLDFIDGTTLGDRLRADGPLDVPTALRIACQMADALVYAHGVGVTHRDVKPSNILIERHPPQRALLIDFGIAKVVDDGDHTRADVLLGTPRYSAPEQLGYRRGGMRIDVDQRADVYALGLVVYEMLEGDALLADLTPAEIMMRVAIDPEPLRAAFTVPVPDAIRAIIDRAIARDPDDRYQSMQDMLDALLACAATGEPAPVSGDAVRAPAGRAIEDIDAHIQALEAEKQLQLVRGAEAGAERARRDASSADASTLVPEVWAEAIAAAGKARDAVAEGRHHEARDAFDQAAERFQHAATEATARRREQFARLARDEMRAMRAEAEHANAATWAAAELADAVARADDAEQAFAAGHHEDAQRGYVEARTRFTRARITAIDAERRDKRRRLEEARAGAEAARQRAEAAAAHTWAAPLASDATAYVALAEAALGRGDDTDAARAFAEAATLFGEAAVQATDARTQARAAAESARAELAALVDQAHERLDAAELGPDGLAALRVRDDGAAAFDAGDYARAGERFEEAARLLRRAVEQADAAREERARLAALAEPEPEPEVPRLPLVPPSEPEIERPVAEAPTWMMHADGTPVMEPSTMIADVVLDPAPPLELVVADVAPPEPEPAPRATPVVPPRANVARPEPTVVRSAPRERRVAEPVTVVRTHLPPVRPSRPSWWGIALAGGAGVAALAYVASIRPTPTPVTTPARPPVTPPIERAAEPPTQPNRAPVIVSQMPAGARLALAEGESARFEVRGEDADDTAPPAVTWRMDGEEVARAPQWKLTAPSPKTASGRSVVEAELRDAAGATVRARWDVDVTATAPRIVRTDPSSGRVRMTSGEPRTLRADAKSGNAEPVAFEWTLDGGKVVRTTDGRFSVPTTLQGEHRVEVAAVDTRGLRSQAATWTLQIEPTTAPPPVEPARTAPPATLPVVPARVEPPATAPPAASHTQLTEADVRDWLGRVERAYEARNPRAIVDLGAVKPSQLPSLEKHIQQYRTLDVDIADPQISLQGEQAVVSFQRTDRDETGRALSLPRQKFRLVRGPSGIVAERIE